jgi:hypothetical protein
LIDLYLTARSPVRKAAEAAIPGPIWAAMTLHTVLRKDVPPKADLVLQVGKGAPSILQERLARNLEAAFVCLPEAGEYLTGRVTAASDSGTDLVMVDAGLATSKQVIE